MHPRPELTGAHPGWRNSARRLIVRKHDSTAMPRFLALVALSALSLGACRYERSSDPTFHTVVVDSSPTPTATPSSTPSTTTTDLTGTTNLSAGAPMSTENEEVSISSVDTSDSTTTLITVTRSNGELWDFEVPALASSSIGSTLTYTNGTLVFGSTDGRITFADGSVSQISTADRVQ